MAIFHELPVLGDRPPVSELPRSAQAKPMGPTAAAAVKPTLKPDWIRIRPPQGENYLGLKQMFRERKLHTVCEEARCPNVSECWSSGTATLMLGSDTCTRACRFCAIKTARTPPPLDPAEPLHVAQSIADMGLHYVVLTSVDRDDLEDGGAGHFAATVQAIKERDPEILVEALVSDFQGDPKAVHIVVDSGLDVYAHNIETVKRLQARVRDPRAGYLQSLGTLLEAKRYAHSQGRVLRTKSSIMLGLGETDAELEEAFQDLRAFEVDVVTLGQYLRPSLEHLPVERFVTPEEFERYKKVAESYGFLYVASGVMVRSSYKAAELFIQGLLQQDKKERSTSHGISST